MNCSPGKTIQVSVEAGIYVITVEPGIIVTAPRTASRDIRRHRASSYQPPQGLVRPDGPGWLP